MTIFLGYTTIFRFFSFIHRSCRTSSPLLKYSYLQNIFAYWFFFLQNTSIPDPNIRRCDLEFYFVGSYPQKNLFFSQTNWLIFSPQRTQKMCYLYRNLGYSWVSSRDTLIRSIVFAIKVWVKQKIRWCPHGGSQNGAKRRGLNFCMAWWDTLILECDQFMIQLGTMKELKTNAKL